MQDSIMARLKRETQELHEHAEQQTLQQRLVQGEITPQQYAEFLKQMLMVHRALETRLRSHLAAKPCFRAVLNERHFQVPRLERDLDYLKAPTATATPLPATQSLIREIERLDREEPVALLGLHYVLEGSNNGAKFIAKGLARAFGWTEGQGLSYLDPYGDQQRAVWQAYKQAMDGVGFSVPQMDRIVEAAKGMFRAITGIGAELLEATETPDAIESAA